MFYSKRTKGILSVIGLVVVCALACTLGGCKESQLALTDPAGNPVLGGPVCVNTANGKFCYTPNPPQPGTAATTPPLEK